jgi:DNA-binding MarR family transcriptional regulator
MGQETEADDEVTTLATRLAVAVGRLNRRIRPGNPELSYGQLSALASVVRLGPLRPGDLARLESTSAPSITRLIANLEAKGFVDRAPDPVDGRAFFIRATPAGAEAVLRARAERAGLLRALLADCSPEDLAALAAALPALEGAGQRGDSSDAPAPS